MAKIASIVSSNFLLYIYIYKYLLIHFFLRKQANRAVAMIDRLDGIKRDKEIKCTRIRQPSLPFVQINTRYACNYARASNFVCALLKRFDFLCHRIFQSFSPRRDKIKIGSCLCNTLIVNEFHPCLKYPVHHR